MQQMTTLEQMHAQIQEAPLSLLLIKTDHCGVCDSVMAKLDDMLPSYPKIQNMYIRMEDAPKVSGEFLVFTAPTLLLFAEGKEVFRQSRFILMGDVEKQLQGWSESLQKS
ncbi:thioredoxin family protein [Paenibacillus sp. KQZ6P-2]|uniref:Thioredoxin family protein n=1 Tax=Paenibacillus mangrovi TaxID=2931978 RepID=A0A9X1WS61_9BACL|nr:thioredoxin family protein [Paenibacillus mangrovi]MCJ8012485.1 thioredoxin family protein [Paenibacillus mangrovi]